MSIHDPNLPQQVSATKDVGVVGGMENLAGLVEDMMTARMSRSDADLEQAVRERLGPNATLDDAKRLFDELNTL
jgi:hypothetical protein